MAHAKYRVKFSRLSRCTSGQCVDLKGDLEVSRQCVEWGKKRSDLFVLVLAFGLASGIGLRAVSDEVTLLSTSVASTGRSGSTVASTATSGTTGRVTFGAVSGEMSGLVAVEAVTAATSLFGLAALGAVTRHVAHLVASVALDLSLLAFTSLLLGAVSDEMSLFSALVASAGSLSTERTTTSVAVTSLLGGAVTGEVTFLSALEAGATATTSSASTVTSTSTA